MKKYIVLTALFIVTISTQVETQKVHAQQAWFCGPITKCSFMTNGTCQSQNQGDPCDGPYGFNPGDAAACEAACPY